MEQVKRAIRENPERPNAAGLAVVDAEIAQSREAKWDRLVKAAESIQPKEGKDG